MIENLVIREFNRNSYYDDLVEDYFRRGNVDKVMAQNPGSGVSFAGLHRELTNRGIIKSTRGSGALSIKHALYFFWRVVEEKLNLESLYRNLPPSVKKGLSIPHIHRVWQNLAFIDTPNDKVRRFGTMLVIHPEGNNDLVLVGRDVSAPSDKYGKKFGALTFPMGFTFRNSLREGALRILQQEVATPWAIEGKLSPNGDLANLLVPRDAGPFMELNIVDVRVRAHELNIPPSLCTLNHFGSYKLTEYKWMPIAEIAGYDPDNSLFRSGVVDVARGYLKFPGSKTHANSTLNSRLHELFGLDQFRKTVWARSFGND